jgi:hypothetical protein
MVAGYPRLPDLSMVIGKGFLVEDPCPILEFGKGVVVLGTLISPSEISSSSAAPTSPSDFWTLPLTLEYLSPLVLIIELVLLKRVFGPRSRLPIMAPKSTLFWEVASESSCELMSNCKRSRCPP